MDKKTKLYLGIGLLGVGVYLYFKPSKNMVGLVKPKPKNTITSKNSKCKFYPGKCDQPKGTIIQDWEGGGHGIIVIQGTESTQCMICSVSPDTADGMPIQQF